MLHVLLKITGRIYKRNRENVHVASRRAHARDFARARVAKWAFLRLRLYIRPVIFSNACSKGKFWNFN